MSPKEVNFYDYDGTCLYAYTVEEAQALSELPALPEREGLICQGWNWNLDDIKSHNRAINVGATYITDDGTTRIYIHLEAGRTSPMMGVCPNGTVTVDWGDGTTPDVLTGTSTTTVQWTPTHEYAEAGDYVIRLTVDGEMCFWGSDTSNAMAYILRHSANVDVQNSVYQNAIRKVEIGGGMTVVGQVAFKSCYSLASITIPNGVTQIMSMAFEQCYSLASIIIPNGVTNFMGSTFWDCRSLVSISIPNSVTRLGNNGFFRCYSLASITIPNSVTQINGSLFNSCCSLASIIIPNSVTQIGSESFGTCHSLASISIPNSVTQISYGAMGYCYSLASISIPNSVTEIGSMAFYKCGGVKYYDFTKHTAVPALSNKDAFGGIAPDCEILVPSVLYDEWIGATNWATLASQIVVE